VRIGGGYLRFQAQYLRRIRVPEWGALPSELRKTLTQAGESGLKVPSELLEQVYGLSGGSLSFIEDWERP
jgi:hypothetical protein